MLMIILITLVWLSIFNVSFLTGTKMRTSSVGTICINITGMVAIVALITIFKRK